MPHSNQQRPMRPSSPNVRRLRFALAFGLAALTLGTWEIPSSSASENPDAAPADSAKPSRPKRLLLLAQSPDGHPFSTHEYAAGLTLVATCLQSQAGVQPILVNADEPWEEGPELLDGADGAMLFLSEGAKWLSHSPKRAEAFERLAKRGGGLACLHWGMGCKDAAPVERYVRLFGGCHGGPDRKYQVVTVKADVASPKHPVAMGLAPFEVEEEFYYALKLAGRDGAIAREEPAVTPLIRVPIDGAPHTVAWAWERPDGGRSFGFSGGHYHRNWSLPEYRRLVAQGALWTLKQPVPDGGLNVEVKSESLKLTPRKE